MNKGNAYMVPSIKNKRRIGLLLVLFFIGFMILIVRLAIVQLVEGTEYEQLALDQWTRELDISPLRGQIVDTNGIVLAQSATSYNVSATPKMINSEKAHDIAVQIASVIEVDVDELEKNLKKTDTSQVWVKRQITKEEANAIRALEIKGLHFTEEPQRFYPQSTLASNVLGFTKKYPDGNKGLEGQEGLELYYNKYLTGYAGKIVRETDASGRELPYSVEQYLPPVDGMNLKLTIDSGVQHFAEKAAAHAMEEYQAKKIYCIVMEPKTGKILAMVNQPTFDSNHPPRELGYEKMQEYIKNFNCKDSVDPGSIFKVITLSAALEEGAVNLNSTFYCPGYRIVDGDRIKCWKTAGHGSETLAEVVQNSCNPAFMDMALALGKDKYYDYLYKFGFGSKTGIDVLGESSGILIPQESVKNVDLARIGFGQSVSVTPIQMITGIAAAINGGNVMKPYLVEEIYVSNIDAKTGKITNESIETFKPHVEQRVISDSTSKIVRDILKSVVDEGSGKRASIAGYSVGGKTGTAQKYGENHQVITDRHISSFVGFAPVDDPKAIVIFMVDEPITAVDYGSVVAAPYVKMILEDTLPYLGVEKDRDEGVEGATTVVPDLTGMTMTEAVSIIEDAKLDYSVDRGEGDVIAAQIPMPEAEVPQNTTLLLYLGEKTELETIVPNVVGLTVREANALLAEKKLQLVIEGNGVAVSQKPSAGETTVIDNKVTVVFE